MLQWSPEPKLDMPVNRLTKGQKREFLRDGFVVIKNAVPKDISQKARDLITAALPKDEHRLLVPAELATHPDVVGLFGNTCLAEIMRREMGPFPDVISCQVAVTPGHDKTAGRPGPHVDGSWGGVIPSDPAEIDLASGRPKDAASFFGENDDRLGTNDGQLWQDPERRMSLGSFTAIVGVALNDQSEPGNGQFGVLRGMHEEVEAQFRKQRDSGGIIGPEGAGWPRIKLDDDGKPFLNGLFESVRAKAKVMAQQNEPIENWPWPEMTPICLEQGDAVIALHSCPHSSTPNLGPKPRMNCYFRVRRLREDSPHEGTRRLGHGVSDHLDRGYFGQFLDYPNHYDPWQTSIDKLCDHWSEWDGMHDVVADARPNAD